MPRGTVRKSAYHNCRSTRRRPLSAIPTCRNPRRCRLSRYSIAPVVISDESAFNRNLGRRIRAARKRKGMNQGRLADLLELGRTSIVMIEKGEQRVHAHLLVSLATELGTPVTELLGLTESIPVPPNTKGLPHSKEARAWVLTGLTQPIVITAEVGDEEEDRGDQSENQG